MGLDENFLFQRESSFYEISYFSKKVMDEIFYFDRKYVHTMIHVWKTSHFSERVFYETSCFSRRVMYVMRKTYRFGESLLWNFLFRQESYVGNVENFSFRRGSYSMKLPVLTRELCMYVVNVINEPSYFGKRVMFVQNFRFSKKAYAW